MPGTFPHAEFKVDLLLTGQSPQQDPPPSIFEAIALPLWIFDIDKARVHWANPPALKLWNASSLDELRARDMSADMSPSVRERLSQYQEDFAKGHTFTELWTLYPKGKPHTYRCHFSGTPIDKDRVGLFCQALGEAHDQDAETLRSVQALLLTSVMISLYDYNGELLYANPAARKMLGGQTQTLVDHFAEDQDYNDMLVATRQSDIYRAEVPVNSATGQVWHELAVQTGPDAVSGENAYLLSESDISDRRAAQQRAHQLAYYDGLTGLPNRTYLIEQLEQQIKSARRYGSTTALCFMDIDRFKNINDTLGHSVGDELLAKIAGRIKQAIYETDTVGRLGGDEFVCILRDLSNSKSAAITATRILEHFAKPFTLSSHELFVTPSIGISVFPDDAESSSDLMKNADIAMYEAKASGGNAFVFFDTQMNQQVQDRLSLEAELRAAIHRHEFTLFYQPRVDITTGEIIGVEALLRWDHPSRGLLTPYHFISVAEETGLLAELGTWVLNEATRQQVAWESIGFPLRMAVNISARQFLSGSLCEEVDQALADSGCRAQQLELEITESVFMGSEEQVLQQLRAIHSRGVVLAVDDFGTGYSNLAYLQNFPIDCLKIDQSFVNDFNKPAILDLIISLGQLLNVRLVAEGVETVEQRDWLRERGCHEYQGYYYSKPVSAAELQTKFLAGIGRPPTQNSSSG